MANRQNRPSERILFDAVTIARDPSFRDNEGWGGYPPTDLEVVHEATHQAIMSAIARGDTTSGPGWRTSFVETPELVLRLLQNIE